jgi:hypothetical protein
MTAMTAQTGMVLPESAIRLAYIRLPVGENSTTILPEKATLMIVRVMVGQGISFLAQGSHQGYPYRATRRRVL